MLLEPRPHVTLPPTLASSCPQHQQCWTLLWRPIECQIGRLLEIMSHLIPYGGKSWGSERLPGYPEVSLVEWGSGPLGSASLGFMWMLNLHPVNLAANSWHPFMFSLCFQTSLITCRSGAASTELSLNAPLKSERLQDYLYKYSVKRWISVLLR